MAYNKVVYDGQTLIDLTQDDVQASDVRNGVYFHSADGVRSQGTLASTSVPTADTIAEWDSDAHMNSEDMTSQEVDDFVDSLNVSGINAVDYVVEQGTASVTNGTWYYRKWNSGVAEAWIKRTTTATINAGSHYALGVALPSFFISEPPIVTGAGGATAQPQAFLAYTNIYGNSGSYGIDAYIRNNGGSNASGAWQYFYAIGKWK